MKQTCHLSLITGILVPLFLWMGFTPWADQLDLNISQLFYHEGAFASHSFWDWIYVYGLVPAWIMAGSAFIGMIFSFFHHYRSWRRPCIYLLLTLGIGSGLIIHACLKDHWGRPRPKQVMEFGGKQHFRSYYQPNVNNQTEPAKSFACGHASLGFYFFSLVWLGIIYRSRFLYWFGLSFALGLGGLLSAARIAQGGHFFSDTMASALIMWFVALGLAYIFFGKGLEDERINTEAE